MILDRIFKKRYPALDWIQVDISSLCESKCIYCPHTEYKNSWQNRLLPLELFERIVPAFKKTKLVFLQGWGEPFTNPQFVEFLRLAKKAGCMTGTTTNGMLLDTEKIKELVDEGLDIICFSLAGIDRKNDAVRKGTSISHVLKCIEEVHRIKNSLSVDKPEIHIAYMLLRSGLEDLDKIPAFSENAGISQTVVSSLSLLVNPEMAKECLDMPGEKESSELINRLNEVKIDAERRGAGVFFNIVSPLMKKSFCGENTGKALVAGSDGNISPCIMGCLPVKGDNYFYFEGKQQKIKNISFGNIADEPLNEIWNKGEYKNFRQSLNREGIAASFCNNCMKRFPLDFPVEETEIPKLLPEL